MFQYFSIKRILFSEIQCSIINASLFTTRAAFGLPREVLLFFFSFALTKGTVLSLSGEMPARVPALQLQVLFSFRESEFQQVVA